MEVRYSTKIPDRPADYIEYPDDSPAHSGETYTEYWFAEMVSRTQWNEDGHRIPYRLKFQKDGQLVEISQGNSIFEAPEATRQYLNWLMEKGLLK